MTAQRYLILAIVTLTGSCGDTFLSRGMKSLGPVSIHHLGTLVHAILTPWVGAGIVFLIGFFASYLTALSWADLTYVLPATSLGYVIQAVLAHFWLQEHVSPWRWLGIVFITGGVGFVTQGPSYTDTRTTEADSKPAGAVKEVPTA
jgi:drug/metabolite transporter (DMT)-like permease